MLLRLKIKNFALIENIEMDFNHGFTAITGETGAGKSILLEALGLVFGNRADALMIRHGEAIASVEGTFLIQGKQVLIEREIAHNGRHQMKIDGVSTTLKEIKKLTNQVALIHSQDDAMIIMQPNEYLDIIDRVDLDGITPLINQYSSLRNDHMRKVKKLEKMQLEKSQSLEMKDFLEYQLLELEKINPQKDELKKIKSELAELSNYDKIKSNLSSSAAALQVDFLYDIAKKTDEISAFDEKFYKIMKAIENSYYQLNDVKQVINTLVKSLDFDGASYQKKLARSYELSQAERKFKKTGNELVEYYEDIKAKIAMNKDYDAYIHQMELSIEGSLKEAMRIASSLSEIRKKNAQKLSNDLVKELAELNLLDAKFKVKFKKTSALLERGIDEVEFYISLNHGEPLRVLSKVASGGERSRFIFALNHLYAQYHNLLLLVFDEIDIGISGTTAAIVARKMLEVSKKRQVIVITHLPQVAARANFHYGIEKQFINNRMITTLENYSNSTRVEKIAMMLSGDQLSTHAIHQAKLLLSN